MGKKFPTSSVALLSSAREISCTSVLALRLLMISVPGAVGDDVDPVSLTIGEKGLPAYRAGLDRGVSGNRGPNGESSSRSMVMRSWHDRGTGDGSSTLEGLLMEGIVTRRGEVSDEGGTVSVSGSVLVLTDFGATTGCDGRIAKAPSDCWELWSPWSCTAVTVAVAVELDLFLMLR